MRILDQILGFISKNKKNIFYILLFIVYFFHSSDFAFAADPKPEEKKDVIIQWLNGFLSIVASLLWVLTMFIGLFLRPEWTSWSIIGLDTQLKTMWILISNIVYFVFAWIFITIAFMNIIGHGDHYELKKAIPKFIVWVLIVPFSWFFVQFILSISSILTVWVLSLPFDTFNDLALKDKTISLCSTGKDGWVTINLSATWSNVIKCKTWDKVPIKIWDFIKENDNGGLYSIMTVYTYWVMRLDETGLLFWTELDKWIKNVWWLSVKMIFDLLFLIVYTLLLVALFLAFMTRWFALWFYVMFSPVFWLLHYFWKSKDGMWWWASKKFNLTEFIWLAMVPVYVAAALSFWVLFLHVAGKWFSATTWTSTANNSVIKIEKDSATIGNNTFTFPAWKTINTADKSTLFGWFTWPLWALMIQMLWLAVMWLAVMSALKQSSITANVTDPISQFWDQIGKLVAKAPTYAPILPGGMSAQWLSQVWSSAKTYYENKSIKTWSDFLKRNDLFQSEDVNKNTNSKMAYNTLNNQPDGTPSNDSLKQAVSAIKDYHNTKDLSEDSDAKKLVQLLWSKLGLKDLKVWNEAEIKTSLLEIDKKLRGNTNLPQLSNWGLTADNIDAVLYNKKWVNPSTSTTPGNWGQTITINTNTPWVTQNVSLDLKDGVVQWNKKFDEIFKDAKWQYSESDFESMLTSKWIKKEEATKIVKELKDKISWFFK